MRTTIAPEACHVSDATWERVAALLAVRDPSTGRGRKRRDRQHLDAILYQLISGCSWNRIPRSFGDDSSAHRYYQRWQRLGIFADILEIVLAEEQAA